VTKRPLVIVFFKIDMGNEPAREWLKSLTREERQLLGEDIKTAQIGFFTKGPDMLVILHGFIKKSQITPLAELKITRKRLSSMAKYKDRELNEKHIGSSFDDFLKEESIYDEVVVAATKKALAFKIQQLMREMHISKAALAKQMNTSRSALDRLLDPNNTSVTLQSIGKAASVLGKRVVVDLI